ncbi:MAG: hypothetical protein ABIH72_02155 [archaeon]
MKKTILILLCAFFLVSLASSTAVYVPQPQNMELKPGETTGFILKIASEHTDVICTPDIGPNEYLAITLEPNYTIGQYQRFNIEGQVALSKDAPYGQYEHRFCMLCEPIGIGGTTIPLNTCGLPITVTAVSERSKQNLYEPIKPSYYLPIIVILSIVIIILLAIIVIYLYRKRKSK